MSIKAKLALLISIVVTVILTMNITVTYITTEKELRRIAELQMVTIAKQIGTTLETTERSRKFMEDLVGETLRNAALAAKSELDPRIDHVTNEQLVRLSRKLGVDHITLWVRTPDDIVAVKSSDPKEINLSSKTWDYWHTAFQQLFNLEPVTVAPGQKLENYWSGPIQYSSSNPDRIDKWGYYYDGTTEYMINTYVDAKRLLEFEENNGTSRLIRRLLEDNPNILGIVGFNPQFFGKPPILKEKQGILVQNLDVREIVFGDYTYRDEEGDAEAVRLTASSGQVVTKLVKADGKKMMKSFIPLQGDFSYVAGVTFNYGAIEQVLNRQLLLQLCISIGFILAAWAASYLIAEVTMQPLRLIVRKVGEISHGRFNHQIPIRSGDELGLLSSRINMMANSLRTYMDMLKNSSEELRGTKEYLESFVGHTSDSIHVTDLEGRVIQVNPAFEKMFGWKMDEVFNKTLPNATEEGERTYAEIRKRVLRGEAVADFETVRLTKAGEILDMSVTVSPIRNESGEVVAIAEIGRNITSRKQAEEAIRRSEKLSVVGQLAAGVAHEIRNPLTTVKGFLQLQQQTGKVTASHLEVMLSELDRINLIVSEFLILAKPQAAQYAQTDMRNLLSDIILLLEPLARLSNVNVETRYSADVPELKCEPNQLKQVFINVLKNGIEAMPNGGTITIELEFDSEANKVLVRITDQGGGIPEENMPRLGEPFFTSKPNGTGLGLMVSQRIIANHKGTMEIRSEVGRGTCVEIKLPDADAG